MNCRPGDLAVIVRSRETRDDVLVGRVVRLTTIDPDWHELVWNYEGKRLRDGFGWEILALADDCLRPIRDQDGEDETLTWAGKPESVVIA